jgi:hypothetical protein
MILARITTAIREQNWFAVVLELVIVITGVVIGFQIAAIGERNARKAYEQDLLHRLHAEILNLEFGRNYQESWLTERRDVLVAIRPQIFGVESGDTLTSQSCFALIDSHQLIFPPDSLPALDELVSTGRMENIVNDAIRSSASEFLQKRDLARSLSRTALENVINLPEAFPGYLHFELVEAAPSADGDAWNRRAICDLGAMQRDRQFQTMLAQNIEHFRGILRFNYSFIDESITAIHAALDGELGIDHEEDAQ